MPRDQAPPSRGTVGQRAVIHQSRSDRQRPAAIIPSRIYPIRAWPFLTARAHSERGVRMAWRLVTTNVFIRIGKTPVVQADPTAFGRVVPAYKHIVWHGAQRSEHHAKTMERVWAYGATRAPEDSRRRPLTMMRYQDGPGAVVTRVGGQTPISDRRSWNDIGRRRAGGG